LTVNGQNRRTLLPSTVNRRPLTAYLRLVADQILDRPELAESDIQNPK